MKYAAEMGSGAMTYIPSFIKIGSAIHRIRRQMAVSSGVFINHYVVTIVRYSRRVGRRN
jgi:hypothetical protein